MSRATPELPPTSPLAGDGPAVGKPPSLAMLADQVHLWPFSLTVSAAASAAQAKLLSSDETARAARFHFARDRVGFIAGRAGLRRILAHYLEADPAALAFSYGPAGKPELCAPTGEKDVKFNLSHSADWALLAVTRGREIGVDLERIRAERDLAAVARRFFAPAEFQALAAFAPPRHAEAFCACWTRKEALLKAFGAGLSLPLDGFCVSIDPQQPARLISTEFRPAEARRWALADVDLDPPLAGDFRAALAVEAPLPELRTFRLDDLAMTGVSRRAGSSSKDR